MIRTIIKYKDNKILLDDAEVFEIHNKMPPGIYDIEFDQYNQFKNFLEMKLPKVFPLMPSDELSNIQDYTTMFLSDEYKEFCKSTKIHRKTGILLYGLPGIGKSNYFSHIMKNSIENNNAVVFNINSFLKLSKIGEQLQKLRNIQDELFIVLLEEIDELFQINSAEGLLKNLMDGIDSIDNILFLASTNYIESVPKSLKERPSRFKKVLNIEQSSDTEKVKDWLTKTYKIFIPNLEEIECEDLHERCFNKSIDEIKHILIDYKMGITKVEKKRKIGFKG